MHGCALAQGADILDIGGESSRPGTAPVPLDEELARVLPVLREAVQRACDETAPDDFRLQVMARLRAEQQH